MKKIIMLTLILLLAIGFSGCSKGFSIQIGAIENNSKKEMSASYMKFDGTKEKEITVDDGETIDIAVDIETEGGAIDVFIYNEDDEYSYEGRDIPTSSFTVTLSEAGTYTLKVVSNNHKGGYSFKWK
jgi:hypothetical protein